MLKKVLTVQDISCLNQCSMKAALPILCAFGYDTAILPTAILSTHTAGYGTPSFLDLTKNIEDVIEHWKSQNVCFDAVYTGYLGRLPQIDLVLKIFHTLCKESSIKIVDPAMADHGKLYSGIVPEYAEKMKELCNDADVLIPNLTEACLLAGKDYKEEYDRGFIEGLLLSLNCKTVILTGVSCDKDKTGVAVKCDGEISFVQHEKMNGSFYGTGDIFASVFTGEYLKNKDVLRAVNTACDFTLKCIKNTPASHWQGVNFEPLLGELEVSR